MQPLVYRRFRPFIEQRFRSQLERANRQGFRVCSALGRARSTSFEGRHNQRTYHELALAASTLLGHKQTYLNSASAFERSRRPRSAGIRRMRRFAAAGHISTRFGAPSPCSGSMRQYPTSSWGGTSSWAHVWAGVPGASGSPGKGNTSQNVNSLRLPQGGNVELLYSAGAIRRPGKLQSKSAFTRSINLQWVRPSAVSGQRASTHIVSRPPPPPSQEDNATPNAL